LYIYINSSGRIQLNTTSTTKYTIVEGIKEIVKNFVMALINLRFVCLMALLLISTTCLTSQVSGRNNIGTFLSRRAYQLYYREICGFREPHFILLLDSPVWNLLHGLLHPRIQRSLNLLPVFVRWSMTQVYNLNFNNGMVVLPVFYD
uniref:Uncharacterized protein n=1 Tax=Aegilops tauschii subsp. strangulata TaxID=200361 RepID=A0A452YZW0_AEGTS